jgi:phosphoglycolate phosphatase-like HAD superfamily hydrolase
MTQVLGFDMDGVLLDSDDFSPGGWIVEAFMKTLRDFGVPETEENGRALYIVRLLRDGEAFCRRYGIPSVETLWNQREENYLAGKLAALEDGRITLFPDISALETLHTRYRLGIVSNSPQVVVDRVVERFSLDRLFAVWIGRGSSFGDLRHAKPAPDLLEEMKTALSSNRGFYVGDQPEDAQAARAASLSPILLSRNGSPADVHSLAELAAYLSHTD